MWKSEGSLGVLILIFYHVDPEDETQVIRFGSKCLSPSEPSHWPGKSLLWSIIGTLSGVNGFLFMSLQEKLMQYMIWLSRLSASSIKVNFPNLLRPPSRYQTVKSRVRSSGEE